MPPRRSAAIAADARRKHTFQTQRDIKLLLLCEDDDEDSVPRITENLTISCVGCKYVVKNGTRLCSRTGSFFHMGDNYCKQHYNKTMGLATSKCAKVSLSKPECHMVLFVPEVTQCSICFAAIDKSELTLTNCGHMFHHSCLLTWKLHNSTCPYCRRTTNPFRGNNSRLKVVEEIRPRSFC